MVGQTDGHTDVLRQPKRA